MWGGVHGRLEGWNWRACRAFLPAEHSWGLVLHLGSGKSKRATHRNGRQPGCKIAHGGPLNGCFKASKPRPVGARRYACTKKWFSEVGLLWKVHKTNDLASAPKGCMRPMELKRASRQVSLYRNQAQIPTRSTCSTNSAPRWQLWTPPQRAAARRTLRRFRGL